MAPSGAIVIGGLGEGQCLSVFTNRPALCSTIFSTIPEVNKRSKLLDAMRNHPQDWRIEQLLAVAFQFGIACRNHGSSHHVFSYPGIEGGVCVPAHRPIKPVYIRQFLSLVDSVMEMNK